MTEYKHILYFVHILVAEMIVAEAKGKTESFLKAIDKYASEQQRKIEDEINLYKQKELEKAETEILGEVHSFIQYKIAEMKGSISREISIKEMDCKKKLLRRRQEIVDEVFSNCEKKLAQFTNSDKYQSFIDNSLKKVSKILDRGKTIIYLRKEDFKFKDKIKSNFEECEIKERKDILIGGIYALNESLGLVIDDTLDSKLDEQHEWFAENCGLTLS